MKKPEGLRPLKRFEKQTPWLVMAVVGSVFLLLAEITAILAVNEFVTPSWGYVLRGYTPLGLALGVIAAILSVVTFLYSLRKRALQERMPLLRGTMMMWMWAHVYFGLLALLIVAFHAGPGLISWQISSGKIVLAVFLLLTLSGVAWRLVYRFLPPRAAGEVGNYSVDDSADKANRLLVEIEKRAAGRSAEFQRLKLALEEGRLDARQRKAANLNAKETRALAEMELLFARRKKYIQRRELQTSYNRFLQGWRFLHIPMAVAFALLLVIHIVDALQIPQQVMSERFAGFPSATDCASCHSDIVAQWAESMHAHAVSSPVTQAQTNQVALFTLNDQTAPDPALFCNNCHAPVGALLSGSATLPFQLSNQAATQAANEGVSCSTCHQFTGVPVSGGGGLASIFQEDMQPGRTFFGVLQSPVANAYHQSLDAAYAQDPSSLCQSCHNVNYDLDGDGRIVKGVDLILQTTYDEYIQYRSDGGFDTCVTCHMPSTGSSRAAESAELLFQQDVAAPPREVHDHSFVGVDYPLDKVSESDPQRDARLALLRQAAQFEIDPRSIQFEGRTLRFSVNVTNIGVGHNLPTGFAFARQMWFEIQVRDQRNSLLFDSGVLAGDADDLCDAATMDDVGNPVMEFFIGCRESDSQLVNFQLKLVDDIDILRDENGQPLVNDQGEFILIQAAGAEETWLQALTGGAVVRVRPADGQALGPIAPGQTRSFQYQVELPGSLNSGQLSISARLLFRNLPPYFVRALAAGQPSDEVPQLGSLVQNLQVAEMASSEIVVDVP